MAHALPSARELADRVTTALDATEWSPRRRDRTRHLKQRVWELGFDVASECGVALYPFAGLGNDLADYAGGRLEQRSAHFYPHPQEHSTVKEWAYDVAWATFGGEYTAYSDDRHTAEQVPFFDRLVLALESELEPRRWDVLTDLNKLLCARADLRVMVWTATLSRTASSSWSPGCATLSEGMRGPGCSVAGGGAASSTASTPERRRRAHLRPPANKKGPGACRPRGPGPRYSAAAAGRVHVRARTQAREAPGHARWSGPAGGAPMSEQTPSRAEVAAEVHGNWRMAARALPRSPLSQRELDSLRRL